MVDYREIKNPKSLKPVEIEKIDEPHQTGISIDIEGAPNQIDFIWKDDETLTFPSTKGVREDGYKFKGYISPQTVRDWYRAKYEKKIAPPISDEAEESAEDNEGESST